MTVKLTFYDGVNCIGGNKILLEDGEYAIFLDFGINFNEENKYFDEFLRPRQIFGIYDLLHLNLLPPLRGLYREDLELPNIWDNFEGHFLYRKVEPIAILISHAHLDHLGYLPYITHQVPVITSLTSALIIKSLEDTSKNLSDLCFVKLKNERDGILKAEENIIFQRKYITHSENHSDKVFEFWKRIERKRINELHENPLEVKNQNLKIDPFEIMFFPVDHSIPGAGSFTIKTSSGWIVYTGDLRLHGRNGHLTKEFINKLKHIDVKVLICEGTHPDIEKIYTEDDVKEKALEIVKSCHHYVIADFGPRNIDRLMSFLEIGKETGRRLVLTLKDIYLLESLSFIGYPDPKRDEFITFYEKPKGNYDPWEKNLLERYKDIPGKAVNSKDIRKNPQDYILCISYYDFHLLLDILPDMGVYIFSSSEAFNEEMKIDQQKIENWLKYFNLEIRGNLVEKREESPLHASGHIHGDGLSELISNAKPEILIPVHSEKADFFEKFKDICKIIYPEKGKVIYID